MIKYIRKQNHILIKNDPVKMDFVITYVLQCCRYHFDITSQNNKNLKKRIHTLKSIYFWKKKKKKKDNDLEN